MFFGIQLLLVVRWRPSGSGRFSLPKCDFKMIRRKNFSVSLLKSFLFGLPGFGTKFRFLFKSLNSFCINIFLERFIT